MPFQNKCLYNYQRETTNGFKAKRDNYSTALLITFKLLLPVKKK